MNNRAIINLFHIAVVAPLLYTLATNQFPEEYKPLIVYLVIGLVIYHLYRFMNGGIEGMQSVCGINTHHIRMLDSCPGYDKPCITIKSGDVVVWTNVGELKHSVTEKNSLFDSGYLYPGETYSIRLNKKGVYEYYCLLHSGWMVGKITVV